MFYSVHAWRLDENDECFKNFPADATNPALAIQCCMELLEDNPQFTLIMLRMWFQVLRFDHELGAIQFFRIPGSTAVTARVDRLINMLPHGKENRVFSENVILSDRKPVKVQMEFTSTQDVIANAFRLMPYLHDDPPSNIIIPAI